MWLGQQLKNSDNRYALLNAETQSATRVIYLTKDY